MTFNFEGWGPFLGVWGLISDVIVLKRSSLRFSELIIIIGKRYDFYLSGLGEGRAFVTLKNKMVVFRGGAVCLSVDPLRHIFKKVLVKVVGTYNYHGQALRLLSLGT